MSSSRIILVFLGIIFLIIVILSSNKIGESLRSKFGKYLPSFKPPYAQTSLTPTPTIVLSPTLIPTSIPVQPTITNNGKNPTPADQIPATGPSDTVYLVILGSLIMGFTLKKLSSNKT